MAEGTTSSERKRKMTEDGKASEKPTDSSNEQKKLMGEKNLQPWKMQQQQASEDRIKRRELEAKKVKERQKQKEIEREKERRRKERKGQKKRESKKQKKKEIQLE